ncbi:hypothetical protein FEF34_14825 [Streptomyces marianii]|uniref:Uncharacterized protein n=1 Tax=Streptomyces marianii TaxID=1817406 RepID=A0A5R9E588_9ACTN|nr:hypothetical protein FEF34_14825 [Streptomyces marianii]
MLEPGASEVKSGSHRSASGHTPRPVVRVHSPTLVHGRAEVRAGPSSRECRGHPRPADGRAADPDGPTVQPQPVPGCTVRTASVLRLRPPGRLTRSPASPPCTARPARDRTRSSSAPASPTAEPGSAPVAALTGVGTGGRTLTVTRQDGTTAVRTCGPPWS